jgi:hypothetical protein
MIVTHKPWSDRDISSSDPIIADMNISKMFSPLYTLYITFVPVVEIVIARDKEHIGKIIVEMFQGP